jgi:hypothetical protein
MHHYPCSQDAVMVTHATWGVVSQLVLLLLLLLLLSLLLSLVAVKTVCRLSSEDASMGAQQQSISSRSVAARLAEASACEENS